MQVVPDLQRERVRTRGQLHVDDGAAIAKVHPWGRRGNHLAIGQTLGVDPDVMVPQVWPGVGDLALRYGRDLEIFGPEFKSHGALHSRPVLGLHKDRPRTGWLRHRRRHRRRHRLRGGLFCRLGLPAGRAGQDK